MNLAIYAINGLLMGSIIALVGLGKINWGEAMAGIALLLTPSVASHTILGAKDV